MALFDRIVDGDGNVAHSDGSIVKCVPDVCDDVQVNDELRKMLLIEESDSYELYDDAAREQFIFQLFQLICIGGAICQYEDNVRAYIEMTRAMYRELLVARKNKHTSKIEVASHVLRVTALKCTIAVEADNKTKTNKKPLTKKQLMKQKHLNHLFPASDGCEHNRCFVMIDTVKRHVVYLNFPFLSFW
jgi:hypothetical protein